MPKRNPIANYSLPEPNQAQSGHESDHLFQTFEVVINQIPIRVAAHNVNASDSQYAPPLKQTRLSRTLGKARYDQADILALQELGIQTKNQLMDDVHDYHVDHTATGSNNEDGRAFLSDNSAIKVISKQTVAEPDRNAQKNFYRAYKKGFDIYEIEKRDQNGRSTGPVQIINAHLDAEKMPGTLSDLIYHVDTNKPALVVGDFNCDPQMVNKVQHGTSKVSVYDPQNHQTTFKLLTAHGPVNLNYDHCLINHKVTKANKNNYQQHQRPYKRFEAQVPKDQAAQMLRNFAKHRAKSFADANQWIPGVSLKTPRKTKMARITFEGPKADELHELWRQFISEKKLSYTEIAPYKLKMNKNLAKSVIDAFANSQASAHLPRTGSNLIEGLDLKTIQNDAYLACTSQEVYDQLKTYMSQPRTIQVPKSTAAQTINQLSKSEAASHFPRSQPPMLDGVQLETPQNSQYSYITFSGENAAALAEA